jgi:hypothetical protein
MIRAYSVVVVITLEIIHPVGFLVAALIRRSVVTNASHRDQCRVNGPFTVGLWFPAKRRWYGWLRSFGRGRRRVGADRATGRRRESRAPAIVVMQSHLCDSIFLLFPVVERFDHSAAPIDSPLAEK